MSIDEPEGTPRPASVGLRARVLQALSATFVVLALDRVIQVAFIAVLARLLTPAEVGVAAAATVFVSICTMFSQFGAGPALIQAPALGERVISAARVLTLASALVFFVAIEAAAGIAGAWFRNSEVTSAVRVLAVLCILQGFLTVPNSALARDLRARDLATLELVCGILAQGLVTIPLAYLGWSYWALILGAITSAVFRALGMNLMATLPKLTAFDRSDARRLWTMGPGFLMTTFLQRLGSESDRLIIGRYLSAADLGLYARANGLMAVPSNFFGSILDRVGFPAFAQVQTAPERLHSGYAQALALTAFIGLPLTVFMVIMGPDIILTLLGSGWVAAIAAFKILSFAAYFRLSDRMSILVLRACGKPYHLALMQLLLGTLVIIGALSVWPWGISAISTVVVAVSMVSFVLMAVSAARIVGMGPGEFLRTQARGAILAAIVAATSGSAIWATRLVDAPPFVALAFSSALTGAAGLAAIAIAPAFFLKPIGAWGLYKQGLAHLSRRTTTLN